jgi:release factor family 7
VAFAHTHTDATFTIDIKLYFQLISRNSHSLLTELSIFPCAFSAGIGVALPSSPRKEACLTHTAVLLAPTAGSPAIEVKMPILNREELHSLVGKQNDHCISIYLSTHRNEAETLQDSIKLKHLLREAEIRLHALGLWALKANELLKPARQLFDQKSFWGDQRDGLALFLADDFFRYYNLPLRFPKLAVVTDRFHLKPLLRYFTSESQFYLLALSQKQVRIFQGSRYSLSEIFLEEMPVSLAYASDEEEPEKVLRFNAGASSGGHTCSGH